VVSSAWSRDHSTPSEGAHKWDIRLRISAPSVLEKISYGGGR
jgi:hypothetical protein